jgi:hypothetical protein
MCCSRNTTTTIISMANIPTAPPRRQRLRLLLLTLFYSLIVSRFYVNKNEIRLISELQSNRTSSISSHKDEVQHQRWIDNSDGIPNANWDNIQYCKDT